DYAGGGGDGKRVAAIDVASGEGANEGVPGTGPEAGFRRSEVAGVLVKRERAAVGDGLADAVVGEIAAVAFSKRGPALAPFFRRVCPLADPRAGSFAKQGDRTNGGQDEFTKSLGTGQRCGRDRENQ